MRWVEKERREVEHKKENKEAEIIGGQEKGIDGRDGNVAIRGGIGIWNGGQSCEGRKSEGRYWVGGMRKLEGKRRIGGRK